MTSERRLRVVPGAEPVREAGAADPAPTGPAPDASGAVVALAARAAGRRAVVPRPRVLTPPVPRPRAVVPAGPVAQRVLRRRLAERLDEAAGRESVPEPGARSTGVAFSVAVVDVDPATSRHPVGRERLLTALGSRLADATRPSDLVVRPAPTRFVLVLSGARDSYGLAAARRRIRDVLSRPVLIDGCPVRSTVAVGVVPAAVDDTVDGILERLDASATRDRRSARRLRSVDAADAPS